MSKRRRVFAGRVQAPRPVDKVMTSVSLGTISATQKQAVIFTATTACTVVGLRWSLYIEGNAGTEGVPHDYGWCIIKIDDGDTANDMDFANSAKFYAPEQNVMAAGVGSNRADAASAAVPTMKNNWNGSSASKRKMRIGDKISFACKGIATETVRAKGLVQLFCKS